MKSHVKRKPTRRTGIVNTVAEVLAEAAATKFNHRITPGKARLALQAAITSAASAAGADPRKMPTLGVLLTKVIEGSTQADPRRAEAEAIRAQIKALRGELAAMK